MIGRNLDGMFAAKSQDLHQILNAKLDEIDVYISLSSDPSHVTESIHTGNQLKGTKKMTYWMEYLIKQTKIGENHLLSVQIPLDIWREREIWFEDRDVMIPNSRWLTAIWC